MDVAYYLSELLGQLGEVNVPGLGFFAQIKVDGYYNSAEGKFYPPASTVEFDEEFMSDDVLEQFIADKKKISLASSKYFTEKYVSSLKLDAMQKEVALAGIGWLHFEGNTLIFRNADKQVNDPAFFGFPPVEMAMIDRSAFNEQQLFEPQQQEPHNEPVMQDEPVTDPEAFSPTEEAYEEQPVQLPETREAAEPVQMESHVENSEVALVPEPEAAAEILDEAEPEIYVPPFDEVEPEDYIVPPEEPERDVYTAPVSPAESYVPAVYTPEQDLYSKPVFTPQPHQTDEEDFIFHGRTYDGPDAMDIEEPKKSYKWLWMSLLALFVIATVAVFAIYKFKPSVINKIVPAAPAPVELGASLKRDDSIRRARAADSAAKKDTTKTNVIVDTSGQTVSVNLVDTFSRVRYEISGGAFKSVKEANASIKNYKKLGFEARILKNVPGQLYHLTLGTYFTKSEAIKAEAQILKTGQISRGKIGIQRYNPKK